MKVREGPQGENLSLCTYYAMYDASKLKFIPSYSLEIDKELFHTYFLITIDILEDFCSKKGQNFKVIKCPSLNHGAVFSYDFIEKCIDGNIYQILINDLVF